MKFLPYLVCILLCMGCDFINKPFETPNAKVRIARKVRKQVAEKLKKDLSLYPSGSGGQMMNQIHMLALSFRYYQPVNIETARKLLVTAVTEFIDAVNANEEIRPYLQNYPFEAKNIEIRIFLQNLDGSPIPFGRLKVISSMDGNFQYKIDNLETGLFTTIYKESFKEGQKKVKRADFSNQLDNL